MHDYLVVAFAIILFYAITFVYTKWFITALVTATDEMTKKMLKDITDDDFDDHVESAIDLDN